MTVNIYHIESLYLTELKSFKMVFLLINQTLEDQMQEKKCAASIEESFVDKKSFLHKNPAYSSHMLILSCITLKLRKIVIAPELNNDTSLFNNDTILPFLLPLLRSEPDW